MPANETRAEPMSAGTRVNVAQVCGMTDTVRNSAARASVANTGLLRRRHNDSTAVKRGGVAHSWQQRRMHARRRAAGATPFVFVATLPPAIALATPRARDWRTFAWPSSVTQRPRRSGLLANGGR
jgi:hypothetical protein